MGEGEIGNAVVSSAQLQQRAVGLEPRPSKEEGELLP